MGVQTVENVLAMRESQARSLGGGDPLEKEMGTHFSILAWRIPWTEKPGRLQSRGGHKESDTPERLLLSTVEMYLWSAYCYWSGEMLPGGGDP